MKESFEKAFKEIVGVEGGYVNDPKDPGGETKYGISKRSYPNEDIANLTLERAKELYMNDYWNKCHCDTIPFPLDVLIFDTAVNQGTDFAIKELQRLLKVGQDGKIGQETESKLSSLKLDNDTLAEFLYYRIMRYFVNSKFNTYGHGWIKRVLKVLLDEVN